MLLSGDAGPYPEALVAGRLTVEANGPVWRPRRRPVAPVALAGTSPLPAEAGAGGFTRARPTDGTWVVRHPDGARLRLAAHADDIPVLRQILAQAPEPTGPPPPAPPPRRVPRYAFGLVLLAGVLGAFALWSRSAGTVVAARVLRYEGGGRCRVEFLDGGSGLREADAGCPAASEPGSMVDVLVGPLPGQLDALSDAETVPAALVLVLVLVGLALVAVLPRLIPPRGLRRPRAARAEPARVVRRGGPGETAGLGEGVAPTHAAAAAVLSARALREGWSPGPEAAPRPDPEHGPSWWRVPELRALVVARVPLAAPHLLLLGGALAFGLPSWLTVWTLATGDERAIYARVVSVDRDRPPWLTHATRVHFHPQGRQLYATVPTTRGFAIGERVAIVYSPDHPGRARLDQPGNGLRRQAGATGTVAVGSAALAAVLAGRPVLTARRICRLRAGPARPWRYVRYVRPGGGCGLLLYSRFGDGLPEAVVPLVHRDPVGPPIPVSGEALVHGEVGDGRLAVPVVEGVTCWPARSARALPPECVRDLVNGRPSA